MKSHLTPLGNGRVFRDDRSGALVVDADSISRGGFAGEDFGNTGEGAPEYAGPQDNGPGYEGDPDYDNFGASPYPRNRYQNRGQGQYHPQSQYRQPAAPYPYPAQAQPAPAQSRTPDKNRDGVPDGWISTFLTGSTTIDAAGQATVTIRSQHPFVATDVTFEGSASGAKITQIMFGARPVVNATDGIPTSVFTPTSQMRKHLEGQTLKAGLDIVVTGTLTGAGTLSAVFFGYKPPEG